jgi:hypothetical protein
MRDQFEVALFSQTVRKGDYFSLDSRLIGLRRQGWNDQIAANIIAFQERWRNSVIS